MTPTPPYGSPSCASHFRRGIQRTEGLIDVNRFGTVLTDMTIPYQISGQRILKPSGLSFHSATPASRVFPSYQLTVTGAVSEPLRGL